MANDRLPFPHVTARDPESQIKEIIDYLGQFKEELEFILADMDSRMITELPPLPPQLTIADVIGSYAFEKAVKDIIGKETTDGNNEETDNNGS